MTESTTQLFAPSGTLEIQLGTTLGSYEIVELLGKGAMGKVYRARHVRLGREVALKVLNPEFVARPDVVQRFFREARVVNDIDHENIVEVTDFVEQPGLAYLVMELLDGESLGDLMKLKGRKYPQLKRIAGILSQVCGALDAAHAKGVIHRDLKPDNVFVVKRDGADFVKVLDFGVAKLRGGDDQAATTTGMIIGTPHYMSPEQALGREIDRSADVWAAGVVLYELLCGALPFAGESFVELAMQIREKPPKPFPARTPRGERIPPWLGAVVLKCLEKKPADRYRSMKALAEALAAKGADPSRGLPRRLVALVAGLAAGVALVFGAVKLDVAGRIRRTVDRARGSIHSLTERPAAAAPAAAPVAPAQAVPSAQAPKEARPAQAAPQPQPPPQKPAAQAPAPAAAPQAAPKAPPARQATAPSPREAEPPKPKTPPRPTPPPAPAAAPKRPATVELSVRSTPPGARVSRLDTGERLGKTPVRVNVPRKAANAWIQVALDGYQPIKFIVDLRRDNAANITFQGAKKPAHHR